MARGSEADTATANSCDDPLGPIPCAPEQKKQTSNSRKSDRQKRKRKGGFVPMERSDFRKTFGSGSLIDGSARTCLPDAIKLMLFWVGVVVTWQSTRKAMPSGRSEDDDPDVDMANIFLKARGYKAELRPAMASNPLAVWHQKSGIFLLEMSLGDLKHFAVYSAAECTVHGKIRRARCPAASMILIALTRLPLSACSTAFGIACLRRKSWSTRTSSCASSGPR